MHLIIAGDREGRSPRQLVKNLKPLALQRQGEVVDIAFRNRTMDTVREWCKQVRDLGVLVGVGTHKPEVIELVRGAGLGRGLLCRLRVQPHAHPGRSGSRCSTAR